MPLFESESLVIKTYNLAEADRIVVFLTRDHGLVRGVAKGAKRLKSRFGSSLEPYSVVNIEYFEKDSVELVNIQKAELLQSNFSAASNPEFLQKFSYLGDLLITFLPAKDPNETLFRMVKACIETAAGDPNSLPSIGVYFELWQLRLAGYMPDWSKCGACGRAFDEIQETSVCVDFHLVCRGCSRSSGNALASSCRALATAARRMSPMDFTNIAADKNEDIADLSTILKRMTSQALGREIAGEKTVAFN